MIINSIMPGGNKTAYVFKQTSNFQVQVCLSTYDLLSPPGIKWLTKNTNFHTILINQLSKYPRHYPANIYLFKIIKRNKLLLYVSIRLKYLLKVKNKDTRAPYFTPFSSVSIPDLVSWADPNVMLTGYIQNFLSKFYASMATKTVLKIS